MWKVDSALAENTHVTQLEAGGWSAEYHGFVTVSAEGRSPNGVPRVPKSSRTRDSAVEPGSS
jgi:hypothetical protein